LLALILILTTGCSNQTASFNTFNNHAVNLEVDVTGYSDQYENAVTLNIHNRGSTEIRFGTPYKIEELYLGTWREVPFKEDDPAWTQVEFILYPFDTNIEPVILNQFREEIKIGHKYRVIKTFVTEDGREITLAAEFMIGDEYLRAQKALQLYHDILDYMGENKVVEYAGAYIDDEQTLHIGLVGKENHHIEIFRKMAKETRIEFLEAAYTLEELKSTISKFRAETDINRQQNLGIVDLSVNERENKINVEVQSLEKEILEQIRDEFDIEPEALHFIESKFKIF